MKTEPNLVDCRLAVVEVMSEGKMLVNVVGMMRKSR